MTHASYRAAALSAAICLALALSSAADVQAQCTTCATPTVAYAPVVAAPSTVVVAPRLGLFDRLRLRRWGVAYPATTYTAAYAPAYTAAYAPSYVAAYAPTYTASYAPAYTAAYAPVSYTPAATPYLTSYAPLQRHAVSYAPTTVYQPAVLAPVETAPACTTCSYGCSTCTVASPCDSCAATPATGYVDQAGYVAAPTSGCSSCEATSGTPVYSGVPAGSDPTIPIPTIPESTSSGYPTDPRPEADDAAAFGPDFPAPPLFNANGDATASRPTVDIHAAVYRRPTNVTRTSTTAARPVVATPSRTAVDNSGWETVTE